LESELFSALKEKAPAKVIVYMADDLFVSDLRGYLRQGIPLSNALKISLLISDLRARKDIHLPDNPRYRKPEVLRQELEIIELEYQSLRLARKKAEEFGLREIEARLRQKISSKAKSINEYYTIFKKRLKT